MLLGFAWALATGCAAIEVKSDYDFAVEVLPYRTDLEPGEEVELVFSIQPGADGYLHDSTRYRVRYFPLAGSGELRLGDTVLRPNEPCLLPGREGVLHYDPGYEPGEHRLSLTFLDSWGHRQEVALDFQVQPV